MGQSQKDTEITRAIGDISSLKGKTPLDKFNYQFGTPEFTAALDAILQNQQGILEKQASSNKALAQSDAAARLASQGVLGGSLLNSQVTTAGNDINKQLANALQQLAQGRMGQQVGIMQQANQQGFNLANAKTSAIMQLLGQQAQIAANANPNTWLNDLFAGVNAAGTLATPILTFLK